MQTVILREPGGGFQVPSPFFNLTYRYIYVDYCHVIDWRSKMEKQKMTTFMIHVRQDQYDDLKEITERTGVPMAKMIRDAIDKHLENKKDS